MLTSILTVLYYIGWLLIVLNVLIGVARNGQMLRTIEKRQLNHSNMLLKLTAEKESKEWGQK